GDLRVGEDGGRDVPVVERPQVVGVGQVVGDDAGLVVGDVLELVGRADVAQGPDPLGGGPAELVHPDPAVLADLDPGRVQTHPGAVGAAAGGQEGQVRGDRGAVGQAHLDPGGVPADLPHLGPQVHVPPLGGQPGEPLADLPVEVAQQAAAAVDEVHLNAERGEDVRELRGHEAAADDDHRPRQLL